MSLCVKFIKTDYLSRIIHYTACWLTGRHK